MTTEHKRMRQLRATNAQFEALNPLLVDGELALSHDTRTFKVGDGVNRWRDLPVWDIGGDDKFLPLTGGELSGNLTLSYDRPFLRLHDTVEPVGLNKWRIGLNTQRLFFVQSKDDWKNLRIAATLGADDSLPDTHSLVTRAGGDGRYLQLRGGVMTGLVSLAADPVNPLHAATKQYVDGAVPDLTKYYTKAESDARFLKLSGGTMTGRLQIKKDGIDALQIIRSEATQYAGMTYGDLAQIRWVQYMANNAAADLFLQARSATGQIVTCLRLLNATGNVRFEKNVQIGTATDTGRLHVAQTVAGTPAIAASHTAYAPVLAMTRGADTFNAKVTSTPGLDIDYNGELAARIQRLGTTADDSRTVITRMRGDARFLKLAGGTLTGAVTIQTGWDHLVFKAPTGRTTTIATLQAVDGMAFQVPQGTTAARIDPAGATAEFAETVITRARGDARYARALGPEGWRFYGEIENWTQNATFFITHSLSQTALDFCVFMECLTAEHGFTPGQMAASQGFGLGNAQFGVALKHYANGLGSELRVGVPIILPFASTAGAAVLTPANWKMFLGLR